MEEHQGTYGVLKDFDGYKREILEALERFKGVSVASRFPLEEIRNKLEEETFELVVVGQFKRGKSYLINALLGEELLPTGVIPLTSIVTVITYDDRISARVIFWDGNVLEIAAELVDEYVTELKNPGNGKNVKEVWITFPSDYLKGGVRLIDTPGVGSVYRHNTDVAYKYLPRSDAAVFVLSVDQPAGEAEIEFLKDVRGFAHKIFFVLNKIDVIPDRELDLVVDFTEKVLGEVMGKEVKVFPLSAKWALESLKNHSSQLFDASRIRDFTSDLENFLMEEKGVVLLCSTMHRMLWYLSEAALSLELERKALLTPMEEFREKLSIFQKKRSELSNRITYFNSIMDHAVKNAVLKRLDTDLKTFREKLLETMKREVLQTFEVNKELPLDKLNEILKRFVTDGLYENYINWFEQEKGVMRQRLEDVFDPLRREIEGEITELMKFSSSLFDVPVTFSSISLDDFENRGVVFKIKEEPVALELLDSVVTEKVPGWISHRFARLRAFLERKARDRIIKRWLGQLATMADMYEGRVRFAVIKIINDHAEAFRREIIDGLNRIVDSLSDAIVKGMELNEKGEQEVKGRLNLIEEELSVVNDIRTELGNLYQRMSFYA